MTARSEFRALALVPILVCVLPAQEETTLLASGDTWVVESYGLDTPLGTAMTLRVGFEPVLDVVPVEVAFDTGPAWLTVSGGVDGAPLGLLFGFGYARLPLAPLADATLLVDPSPIVALGAFGVDGRFALMLDLNGTGLIDAQVFCQAVAIVPTESGPEFRLSDGLRITLEGMPQTGDPE